MHTPVPIADLVQQHLEAGRHGRRVGVSTPAPVRSPAAHGGGSRGTSVRGSAAHPFSPATTATPASAAGGPTGGAAAFTSRSTNPAFGHGEYVAAVKSIKVKGWARLVMLINTNWFVYE